MSIDDKPPIPKIDETKPVVWTPEDASRFITSAIHEAQRPLAEALKQRPITSRMLTFVISVIILAALVIALILSNQLEKAEKRTETLQSAREEILTEKATLQAQTTTLQDRLQAVTDQQGDLRGQIDLLRQNEEKHKRTQNDLFRFRRQNELLRSQISGLEMEKLALARQLEAVKALAESDPMDDGGEPDEQSATEGDEAVTYPLDPDEIPEVAPVSDAFLSPPQGSSSAEVIPHALRQRMEEERETVGDAAQKDDALPADDAATETVGEEPGDVSAPDEAVAAAPVTEDAAPATATGEQSDAGEHESRETAEIPPVGSPEEFKKDIVKPIETDNGGEARLSEAFAPGTAEPVIDSPDDATAPDNALEETRAPEASPAAAPADTDTPAPYTPEHGEELKETVDRIEQNPDDAEATGDSEGVTAAPEEVEPSTTPDTDEKEEAVEDEANAEAAPEVEETSAPASASALTDEERRAFEAQKEADADDGAITVESVGVVVVDESGLVPETSIAASAAEPAEPREDGGEYVTIEPREEVILR